MKRPVYSFVRNKLSNMVGQIRSMIVVNKHGKQHYFVTFGPRDFGGVSESDADRADKGMGNSVKTRGRDRYVLEQKRIKEEMEHGVSSHSKGRKDIS